MFKGFRDFVLRGNVVDLAVAVIIGTAFGAIVNSLVKDIITPLMAAIVGKEDFSKLVLHVHGGVVTYGNFLNAGFRSCSSQARCTFCWCCRCSTC